MTLEELIWVLCISMTVVGAISIFIPHVIGLFLIIVGLTGLILREEILKCLRAFQKAAISPEGMFKYCIHCGERIPMEARFCSTCEGANRKLSSPLLNLSTISARELVKAKIVKLGGVGFPMR